VMQSEFSFVMVSVALGLPARDVLMQQYMCLRLCMYEYMCM